MVGRGLINTGNTCFLNSVVQALAALRVFRSYLAELASRGLSSDLIQSLRRTLNELESSDSRPLRPPLLEEKTIKARFVTGEQQDPHELLIYMLDHIQATVSECQRTSTDEAKKLGMRGLSSVLHGVIESELSAKRSACRRVVDPLSAASAAGLLSFVNSPKLESSVLFQGVRRDLFDRSWSRGEGRFDREVVGGANESNGRRMGATSSPTGDKMEDDGGDGLLRQNPFFGKMENTLYCSACCRSWSSIETMSVLSLYLPYKDASSFTLFDCFSRLFQSEKIKNYLCRYCQEARTVEKRLTILKAPDLLSLHFNRLCLVGRGRRLKKICGRVDFGLHLNVSWLTSRYSLPPSSALRYSLSPAEGLSAFISKRDRTFALYSMPTELDQGDLEAVRRSFDRSPSEFGGLFWSDSAGCSVPGLGPAKLASSRSAADSAERGTPLSSSSESGDALTSSTTDSLALESFNDCSDPYFDYVLSAVIVHIGNERGGHYVCYRPEDFASPQKGWVKISDMSLSSVPFSYVQQQEAFMLFYQRRQCLSSHWGLVKSPRATANALAAASDASDGNVVDLRNGAGESSRMSALADESSVEDPFSHLIDQFGDEFALDGSWLVEDEALSQEQVEDFSERQNFFQDEQRTFTPNGIQNSASEVDGLRRSSASVGPRLRGISNSSGEGDVRPGGERLEGDCHGDFARSNGQKEENGFVHRRQGKACDEGRRQQEGEDVHHANGQRGVYAHDQSHVGTVDHAESSVVYDASSPVFDRNGECSDSPDGSPFHPKLVRSANMSSNEHHVLHPQFFIESKIRSPPQRIANVSPKPPSSCDSSPSYHCDRPLQSRA
ncbi:uncharacterized protein LOC126325492 [Schistocerca gregaria]|uniref:uncharacterized protein LOC126325492 n=1 Tax=Schistocerca gregaria TaxID=7010 RepID=UPI00211E0DB9|nr:uncharacterized protein LOC126325492 [Schistocerca gregaria]